MKKRAQMHISFGMIFTIILIIIFISFSFYVIKKFLGMQNSMEVGRFVNDFQKDIDQIWQGEQGVQRMEYNFPSKIKMICIVDYSSSAIGNNSRIYSELEMLYHGKENLFFYPIGTGGGIDAVKIDHINISKITENENPFCINVNKGKIEIILEKKFGESLVTIK